MDIRLGENTGGKGCLHHQKFYMALRNGPSASASTSSSCISPTDPPLWISIGSHNCSKSAWGEVKPDLRKKNENPPPKRCGNISNYELSIVIAGKDLVSMLEKGSTWEDLVPHDRNVVRYAGKDKPFNSSIWVQHKNGGAGESAGSSIFSAGSSIFGLWIKEPVLTIGLKPCCMADLKPKIDVVLVVFRITILRFVSNIVEIFYA